jgi:hypothetical protein
MMPSLCQAHTCEMDLNTCLTCNSVSGTCTSIVFWARTSPAVQVLVSSTQMGSLDLVSSFLTELVRPRHVVPCTRRDIGDIRPPLVSTEVTRKQGELSGIVTPCVSQIISWPADTDISVIVLNH